MENPDWLDIHIEQQKTNAEIMGAVCFPHGPAELQEIIESNGEV